jgi:hypothetical protein
LEKSWESGVIASQPYPARYRTRTLNKHLVTASVARQSMHSEVMDCFIAFAMTSSAVRLKEDGEIGLMAVS